MKRTLSLVFALMLPALAFAQARPDEANKLLKSLMLTNEQMSQVQSIVRAAETRVKDDLVHLRLIRAQIDDATLPSTAKVDMAAVGKLVDQETALIGDMRKTVLAAKVQLIGIMGRDNFDRYYKALWKSLVAGRRRFLTPFGMPGQGRFRGPGAGSQGGPAPQPAPVPQGPGS